MDRGLRKTKEEVGPISRIVSLYVPIGWSPASVLGQGGPEPLISLTSHTLAIDFAHLHLKQRRGVRWQVKVLAIVNCLRFLLYLTEIACVPVGLFWDTKVEACGHKMYKGRRDRPLPVGGGGHRYKQCEADASKSGGKSGEHVNLIRSFTSSSPLIALFFFVSVLVLLFYLSPR